MRLNNGNIIKNAPKMSEKTRQYLNQFWYFPSNEEVEKEKEKYYIFDHKREIHRRNDQIENEIDS